MILFDTSAGQAGTFRDKALEALDSVLHSAGANDRVQLFAVDLNPIALTNGFVAPRSPEMDAALSQLRGRVPLGATDMGSALEKAAASFGGKSSAQCSVIYVGDGSNAANRTMSEYNDVVNKLVAAHASVTSFAVGRQLDASLLAAIANQTGGNLLVDTDQITGKEAGQYMMNWAAAPVVWPTSTTLPKSISEILPTHVQPLRTDRDTILLGKLANTNSGEQIKIAGDTASGQAVDFAWPVDPKPSDSENAYIVSLVDSAQASGGDRLPTLGSQGLAEARRLIHVGTAEPGAAWFANRRHGKQRTGPAGNRRSFAPRSEQRTGLGRSIGARWTGAASGCAGSGKSGQSAAAGTAGRAGRLKIGRAERLRQRRQASRMGCSSNSMNATL